MKRIIIICMMILTYQLIYAQNKISAIVTDQDNQPLPGATIFISDMNKGTISDKNGKYQLSDLTDGKIRIMFSFIGYANQIETIELNGKNSELSANNPSDKNYTDHLSTFKEVGYFNPGRNIALSIKIPFTITKN